MDFSMQNNLQPLILDNLSIVDKMVGSQHVL